MGFLSSKDFRPCLGISPAGLGHFYSVVEPLYDSSFRATIVDPSLDSGVCEGATNRAKTWTFSETAALLYGLGPTGVLACTAGAFPARPPRWGYTGEVQLNKRWDQPSKPAIGRLVGPSVGRKVLNLWRVLRKGAPSV